MHQLLGCLLIGILSAATFYSPLHSSHIHLFYSVLLFVIFTGHSIPLSLLPLSLPSFLPSPRPGKKTSKQTHRRPARTSSTTARGRRRHSTTHCVLEGSRLSRHQWYVCTCISTVRSAVLRCGVLCCILQYSTVLYSPLFGIQLFSSPSFCFTTNSFLVLYFMSTPFLPYSLYLGSILLQRLSVGYLRCVHGRL
jgi:hypothetical protein